MAPPRPAIKNVARMSASKKSVSNAASDSLMMNGLDVSSPRTLRPRKPRDPVVQKPRTPRVMTDAQRQALALGKKRANEKRKKTKEARLHRQNAFRIKRPKANASSNSNVPDRPEVDSHENS